MKIKNKFVTTITLLLAAFLTACANTSSGSIQDIQTSGSSGSVVSSNTSEPTSSSDVDNSQAPEPPISKEEDNLNIEIKIGEYTFSATLYDNETANDFKKLLPLTLDMSELNGNEKFYYLPDSLPTNSSCPSKIRTGDIMLYGNSCLVLFYKDFSTSYSYTPIGRIDDSSGLAAALGSGDVQVTFN